MGQGEGTVLHEAMLRVYWGVLRLVVGVQGQHHVMNWRNDDAG